MSHNNFPSSQPNPAQPFPPEIQRSYNTGSLGINKTSRTKTGPAAFSNLPPDLDASEWEYVNRTAQNWNVIQHVSEIRVRDEYALVTSPSDSYQLLDQALAKAKTSDTGRKAILSFLQNHPQGTRGRGSMLIDWNCLVQAGMAGTHTPEKDWVCPSGDWEKYNPLTVIWDYPTRATRETGKGKTADTTNPCTRMLLKKGMNPVNKAMVWLETVHRRISTSVTKCQKSPLTVIHPREAELHIKFVKDQLYRMNSRVVLILGVHARDNYERNLRESSITKLQLPGPSPNWPIHVWIDGNAKQLDIRKVAVLCEHPNAIYYSGRSGIGEHMDAAIRMAAELSGLTIELNDQYFEWMERQVAERRGGLMESPWRVRPGVNPVAILCVMLRSELGGDGPLIKYSEIDPRFKELFCRWTEQHNSTEEEMRKALEPLCPPEHVSIVKGLHAMMVATGSKRGIETQRANGFPSLAQGRETRAAGGYQSLLRGRETQAAGGHQNLDKGRETRAAGGWQSLVKGLETNATGGYQNLAKGRESQKAGGYQNLQKGLQSLEAARVAEFHRQLADANANPQKVYYICEVDNMKCQYAYESWKLYQQHMRREHNEEWKAGFGTAANSQEARRYRRPT
jgi:hypothetical protein